MLQGQFHQVCCNRILRIVILRVCQPLTFQFLSILYFREKVSAYCLLQVGNLRIDQYQDVALLLFEVQQLFFEIKGLFLWHIVVFMITDINNYDDKSFSG